MLLQVASLDRSQAAGSGIPGISLPKIEGPLPHMTEVAGGPNRAFGRFQIPAEFDHSSEF